MKKKIIVFLVSGALAYAPVAVAQNKSVPFKIPVNNGSVFMSVKDKQLGKDFIAQNLPALLGLSGGHSFVQANASTDQLGITHISYQQFFKGVKVDNGMILVHFKEDVATAINGRVALFNDMNTTPAVDKQTAVIYAKSDLEIVKEIRQYPAELLIAGTGSAKTRSYTLAYKTRIDGKTSKGKVVMMNVFVDAQTGKVLKKLSLIAHADVNATAQTLYNGTQTIVTDDSIPGKYRLKDNARKIITLDATGSEFDQDGTADVFFFEPKAITNNSTTWGEQPAIMDVTINTASPALGSAIDPFSGGFLTSLVVKDTTNNLSNVQLKSWLDMRFDVASVADLPVTTQNIYAFPGGDTNYLGSFGIFDFNNPTTLQQASYFPIQNLAMGTHNWDDGQGSTGTYRIANTKNPALDAHWGMERTHDFYLQKFGRNSYDANGGQLINYINGVWPVAFTQNNAAALPAPYFAMVYGMGDGVSSNPLVALDVMGHEFTHMVTEMNGHGGLDYENESGALNESFSDIMGTSIEFFAKGTGGNWLLGEDCSIPAGSFMRSMSNPKSAPEFPQPDTYEGQFWDLSDPHFCSGVQNKWFYLLAAGGTGTNDKGDSYHVYGVGIEKAQQVAYRNLTQYLTHDATFLDAYNGSILAAKDLYGETSNTYHSVRNAWYAVGIGEADTTSPAPEPTAINNVALNGQHLQLYPNPANGTVNIISDVSQNLDAEIVNAVGTKVMRIKVGKGKNTINIGSLAKGIYFIRYNAEDKSYTQKLSVY